MGNHNFSNFFTLVLSFFSTESPGFYEPDLPNPSIAEVLLYLEERAVVSERIEPGQRGRVEFHASWWFALCPQQLVLLPGTPVRVVGRSSLTLIVEPMPTLNKPSAPEPTETPAV